jgi:hypothetical protein
MTSLHQSALASRLKDLYSVRGGTHNDTWEVAGIAYYKVIDPHFSLVSNFTTPPILEIEIFPSRRFPRRIFL